MTLLISAVRVHTWAFMSDGEKSLMNRLTKHVFDTLGSRVDK